MEGWWVLDDAGCAAMDALIAEARCILGERGSPLLLVLLRLGRNRPEDDAARSTGVPAPGGGGR